MTVLARGLLGLEIKMPEEGVQRLVAYTDELLKWNAKVSLTAITDPIEVVDKHLLDSLTVMPELKDAVHLLDLGAGAGFPGIPLAVALPSLRVTLVDAVSKKVAFMKSGAVHARVAGRVKAIHARAEGNPTKEGIPQVDVVISRAFMDVGPFLLLARHYLTTPGRIVAMLGHSPSDEVLSELAQAAGLHFAAQRALTLPISGDPRSVAVFHRK